MAYNITLTNGTNLVTVADGTIVTDYTSLTLVGKNFAGYGSFLNENFVKLIENFANSTEPPYPLQGQIWWDTTNKVLKVRSGGIWKTVSSSSASAAAPVSPTIGDLWWDTVNGQLNVWSGSQWVVIGPSYTSLQRKTGALADSVTEAGGSGVKHIVVKFYVNDVLVAILSKDPSFTVTGLTGFNIINPGFTLSSLGNLGYYGDANNALNLAGIAANKYLRSDIVSTTDFRLNVKTDDGLNVGFNNDFSVKSSATDVNLLSNLDGKNLNVYAKVGGSSQKMMTFHANAGAAFGGITVAADPTQNLGIATKQYVDNLEIPPQNVTLNEFTNIIGTLYPIINNTYDLGTVTNRFETVYANAFVGTASDSSHLGGIPANSYVRNDILAEFYEPVSILDDNGLTVGADGDFTIDVTDTPNAVNLRGNTAGKSLLLKIKTTGGVSTTALDIDGATGLVTVSADPVSNLGIATKQYVDNHVGGGGGSGDLTSITTNILPSLDLQYTVGSSTKRWTDVWATTFHGNASTANYADLAERFESDVEYDAGTVVEMGGSAEVTSVVDELSDNVFGVISTKAAYLMNAGAGNDATHPPIAMQGRVPVKVVGTVKKGDRLVSAGNGKARAALKSEITPYNVIGRSLVNKDTAGEGTIEAIVKLNS